MMNRRANIEDVPEEVMIDIFGYLSPKLLKVAALVNKRWNQIISQSPKILNHFQLNLVPSPRNRIAEGASINRKLSGLKTNNLTEPVVQFMRLQMLTHLELHKMTILKQRLAEVLSLVSNATSLAFDEIKLEEPPSREIEIQPVQFPKLKRLRISNSDTEILGLIATTSLLEFSSVREVRQENITHDEVNLLLQQKQLQSLSLENSLDPIFFQRMPDFPFKLVKLTVLYADPQRFNAFLLQQKDSLEELKVWSQDRAPCSFTFDMPNLKSVTAPRVICPDPVPLMNKLEKLAAVFISSSGEELLRFQHLTRNLKSFDTEELYCAPFDLFFASFTKLESLGLPTNANYMPMINNLKELKFTSVWKQEQLFDNVIRHFSKSLEKLTIEFIDDTRFSRGLTIDAIKSCEKLKFLSVGCSTTLVPRMFRIIKFNHPWTLEVFYKKEESSTSVHNFVHESEWVKLVFKFPDDEALFNGECTTWSDDLIREFKTVKDYGVNAYVNEHK